MGIKLKHTIIQLNENESVRIEPNFGISIYWKKTHKVFLSSEDLTKIITVYNELALSGSH